MTLLYSSTLRTSPTYNCFRSLPGMNSAKLRRTKKRILALYSMCSTCLSTFGLLPKRKPSSFKSSVDSITSSPSPIKTFVFSLFVDTERSCVFFSLIFRSFSLHVFESFLISSSVFSARNYLVPSSVAIGKSWRGKDSTVVISSTYFRLMFSKSSSMNSMTALWSKTPRIDPCTAPPVTA